MKGFAAQFNQLFGELYECVKKVNRRPCPVIRSCP